MKRSSWSDYQKEIADDKYYYVRKLHPSELFFRAARRRS